MVARGYGLESLCYRPGVRLKALFACVPLALACSAGGLAATGSPMPDGRPLIGFTLHWDFFASAVEAEALVAFAKKTTSYGT